MQDKILQFMEYVGYFASILIGVALGLIGGGGSILTVPVLVYLLAIEPVIATSYSLFIVGLSSGFGAVSYFKKGLVNIKTAIVFGVPSIIAVFITRVFLVPAIPKEIFSIGNFVITKNVLIMLLFAILMLFASYSMLKKESKNICNSIEKQKFNYPIILIEGVIVGTLTGLVGAGGGFLIIPALVILSKLPIKEAVGTSLVIITFKSLIGFFGETSQTNIDWFFLFTITSLAIIGIVIGTILSKKIDGTKLKPSFGWFTLAMGIYIITNEIFLH